MVDKRNIINVTFHEVGMKVEFDMRVEENGCTYKIIKEYPYELDESNLLVPVEQQINLVFASIILNLTERIEALENAHKEWNQK